MNWLIRVAYRRFDPDERIIAAAIWANGHMYTGPSHMHAIMKAMDNGALYRDEDGILQSPNGEKHLDLFVTNKGQALTRFQADEYFGISASEDMGKQRPVATASQIPNIDLQRIKEILDATHLSMSPQERRFLTDMYSLLVKGGTMSPRQRMWWDRIKVKRGYR